MSAAEPKYGDVFRDANGALWMVIVRDGERTNAHGKVLGIDYWQFPLTDDRDEEMTALQDTATGFIHGEFVP